jgi:hypothetical protein
MRIELLVVLIAVGLAFGFAIHTEMGMGNSSWAETCASDRPWQLDLVDKSWCAEIPTN